MKVRNIPVSKIRVIENSRPENADVSHLMKSIKSDGLLQPIVVYEEGKLYKVVAGHRRLDAFQKLRRKEIPANVITKQDTKSFIIKNSVENMQRENVSAWEQGRLFDKLKNEFKMKPTEIAASLNVGVPKVKDYLAIYADTPKKYAGLIENSKKRNATGISISKASAITGAKQGYNLNKVKINKLWDESIKHDLSKEQIDKLASKLSHSRNLAAVTGNSVKNIKAYKATFTANEREVNKLAEKYGTTANDLIRMILAGKVKERIRID